MLYSLWSDIYTWPGRIISIIIVIFFFKAGPCGHVSGRPQAGLSGVNGDLSHS